MDSAHQGTFGRGTTWMGIPGILHSRQKRFDVSAHIVVRDRFQEFLAHACGDGLRSPKGGA